MRRPISRAWRLVGAAICSLGVLFACRGERGPLTDGIYTAVFDAADASGWLPFLQIRVRGGNVIDACFDAVNADLVLQSQEEQYVHQIEIAGGAPPLERFEELEESIIEASAEGQISEWRPVAGDESSIRFYQLSAAALASAESGATERAEVPLTEQYEVEDEPDERGWIARLTLRFEGGSVSAAELREYRHGVAGIEWKHQDEQYRDAYLSAHQLSPSAVYEQIEGLLTGSASLAASGASLVDGISGATGTVRRATALVLRVRQQRRAVALPDRPCGRR